LVFLLNLGLPNILMLRLISLV
jgi:hypothetical protein